MSVKTDLKLEIMAKPLEWECSRLNLLPTGWWVYNHLFSWELAWSFAWHLTQDDTPVVFSSSSDDFAQSKRTQACLTFVRLNEHGDIQTLPRGTQ